MSKATLRREKARRLPIDEDIPFREADSFLYEVYSMGVETKVLESCKEVIPIEFKALEISN